MCKNDIFIGLIDSVVSLMNKFMVFFEDLNFYGFYGQVFFLSKGFYFYLLHLTKIKIIFESNLQESSLFYLLLSYY